jgi:hypothetical protein
MVGFDCSGAAYTDYSTTDLNGSTNGISFSIDVNSGLVRLIANITLGSWTVKVGNRIIF